MGIRTSIRKGLKSVDTHWRRSTHFIRPLPDFLIVGAAKSGTTSLYKYLSQHPNIYPSSVKETKYFAYNYNNGLAWYQSHFKPLWQTGLRFEGTPIYLYLEGIAERIHQTIPNAKIIIMLREPVERAWSQYNHNVYLTKRESRSFEEAVQDDIRAWIREGRPNVTIGSDNLFHYVRRSIYIDQVREYINTFGRNKVLILSAERMFANPQQSVNQVCQFLNIPSILIKDTSAKNRNTYPHDIPLRDELRHFFAPYNAALFEMLGIDSWWLST